MSEYTEKQRRIDYGVVFGSEAGARVLADLLRACGMQHSTYVRGDMTHTAFLEGRRSIGLRLQLIVKGQEHERDSQHSDAE